MLCKAYALTGLLLAAAVADVPRPDAPRPLGDGPAAPMAPAAPQGDTRVSSPYWDQGNGGSQSDLPAADIRAVPTARAQATQARWVFNQSQDDLSYALRVNQMQFNLRPDVVAAMSEERAAYDDLQKERQRVVASLNENAAYTASNQLSQNVSVQIADERDSDQPNPVRLLGMASVRMNYVQDNRKLEASLLDRDDVYQKARQRYLDASHKVSNLRQAETLVVMTDANLTALRHQIASARIAKLTTATYRDSVIEARDIAVNYANGYRYNGYLNNSYGGGYGFGNYVYRY